MSWVAVLLNGVTRELSQGETLADVIALQPSTRGVAVAVDGEVVPRAEWSTRRLFGGERIEIVTAVPGG